MIERWATFTSPHLEFRRPTRRLWSLLMLRRSSLRVARWNIQFATPVAGVSPGFLDDFGIAVPERCRLESSMLWGSCAPIAVPYLHISTLYSTQSGVLGQGFSQWPQLGSSEVSILEHFTLGRNLPTLQGTLALLASWQELHMASSFSAVWKGRNCIRHCIQIEIGRGDTFCIILLQMVDLNGYNMRDVFHGDLDVCVVFEHLEKCSNPALADVPKDNNEMTSVTWFAAKDQHLGLLWFP